MKRNRLYFLAWRAARSLPSRERDVDGAWERVRPRRRRLALQLARYAAAVAVVAGVAIPAWFHFSREGVAIVTTAGPARPEFVLPGGERILLDAAGERQASELVGVRFAPDSARGLTRLDARPSGKRDSSSYHQLNIPKGCEYVLRLPDGSLAWLNSETTLRFPLAFAGGDRTVYLEGEAYFEVTRDESAPFRVVCGEKVVTVLGTRFNVSAYADDPAWHATLVEGSVLVSCRGVERELSPSRQCAIDNATGEMTVTTVESSLYTSWMDEQVYFKGSTLEEIVKKLSRWYDFSIAYEDEEIKTLKFRGGINKNRPLEETLRHLEGTTDISFIVDGKRVTARKARN